MPSSRGIAILSHVICDCVYSGFLIIMDREREQVDEVDGFVDEPLPNAEEGIITTGRIANIAIAIVCVLAMIGCIVCLGVMENKHKQVINNIDPHGNASKSDKEVCILYASTENIDENVVKPKLNRSHTCEFVKYGSAFANEDKMTN